MELIKFKIFEKFINDDFKIGQRYSYDQLPKQVRDDIDIQFQYSRDEGVEDYVWEYKLLSPDDIVEYLESVYGEYDMVDACNHAYMVKMIKDIQESGLEYPAVGIEGNHRALACWFLRIPLPYLQPIFIGEE